MEQNWENFWKEWRNIAVEKEEDLYLQVAKTYNRKPIPKEVFDEINQLIMKKLNLKTDDIFVELCCGNGLCTYEFKDAVRRIVAVDFAPHLIESARKFKAAENIIYVQDNVTNFLKYFQENWQENPVKYLMNDSIAYFTPADLEEILLLMEDLSGGSFTFLIRGIPNDALKWNFYNTEERKQRYFENNLLPNNSNDGLGRWWKPEEIEQVCSKLGMEYVLEDQPHHISNFRSDVLISKK